MEAVEKNGRVWRHRITVNRKCASRTFDTKAAALALEAEQRVIMSDDTPVIITYTCTGAFRRYELEVSKLMRGYRWEVLRLAAFASMPLSVVKMSEVAITHVAAWRDEWSRSAQGGIVTREMNLLSHVFSVARKEWKWITTSPTTDVARPKGKTVRDGRISADEIIKICIALGCRIRCGFPAERVREDGGLDVAH